MEIDWKIGSLYEDELGELWKCLETTLPQAEEYPILLMANKDGMLAEVNAAGTGEILNMQRQVKIVRHYVSRREVWVNMYPDVVGNAYASKDEADKYANISRSECIRFIEADWPRRED